MTHTGDQKNTGNGNPWPDVVFDTLVTATDGYIIYVGPQKDLQWATTPNYDEKLRANSKFDLTRHNSTFCDAAVLHAAAKRKELREDMRIELMCLNGNALACIFELDYAGAEKALNAARQFIRERGEEISRFWYMSASFVMAAFFIIVGLSCWVFRSSLENALTSIVVWLIVASAAGATGALFSVILRSGKLRFDPTSGRNLHYLEGASRIWAGALSGIVVTLAIKSDLILGALANAQTNSVVVLAAMAAGTSERLATSIISKFDSSTAHADMRQKKPNGDRGFGKAA